jgi:hypothetical protein
MDTSVSIALITAFSTLTAAGIGALCTYKWEFRKQKLAWKREERKNNLAPVQDCLDELAKVITHYDQGLRDLIKIEDIEILNEGEKQQYNTLNGKGELDNIEKPKLEALKGSIETRRKQKISALQLEYIDNMGKLITNSYLACCRAGDTLLLITFRDEIYDKSFKLMSLEASTKRTSQEYTNALRAALSSIAKAHRRLEKLATEL